MSGAFWRFGNDYQSLSAVNKLLDEVSEEAKELDYQPTLEEQDSIINLSILEQEEDGDIKILDQLLSQQDVLQELVGSNTKLIDFLKNFKILNRLVEYVIRDYEEYRDLKEEEEEEEKRANRGEKSATLEPAEAVSETVSEEAKDSELESKDVPEERGKETVGEETKEEGDEDSKSLDASNVGIFGDHDLYYGLNGSLDSNELFNDDEEEEDETEESPDKSYARRSKVASEILSSDIWSITDAFINYPRLLVKLWTTLDGKQPLSMLKSTFFSQINEHLLDMKLNELISYVINHETNITDRFFNHINNPQLMDFLLKLISTDKPNSSTGIILLLKRQKFIQKLINFLKPKYDNAVQTSAGDFLKAFITISGNSASGPEGNANADNSIIGPNELTRQLVSKKMIKKLVKIMLNGGNSLSNGVGIVIEIIRKNNSDYDYFQVLFITIESHPPNLRDPIYLGHLVKVFARNVKHFKRMLLNGSAPHFLKNHAKEKVETSFQKKIEPLGFERFKICELIAELLHCSNMILLNESQGEKIVNDRDIERVKTLKSEYDLLEESKEQYLDELRLAGDDHLINQIQSEKPAVVDSGSDASEEEATHTQSHDQMVTNINRLSISDEDESIRSVRSEDNRNKRAKVNLSKDGVIQSESDDSDSEISNSDNDSLYDIGNDTSTDTEEENLEDSDYELDIDEDENDGPTEEELSGEEFKFDFRGLVYPNSYRNEFHVKNRGYYDANEKLVRDTFIVGDQLKIALQDSNILLIIVDFFFRFPWNNFLHNVVYDIVQQVLNGSIELGFNKYLIINLFLKQRGFILEKILRGYDFCEQYEKANEVLRLGYMGHLTLISEEIVKFLSTNNLKSLFGDPLPGEETKDYEFVNNGEEWNHYVNNILIEIRVQFNSVLGGESLADDYEIVDEGKGEEGKDQDDEDEDEEKEDGDDEPQVVTEENAEDEDQEEQGEEQMNDLLNGGAGEDAKDKSDPEYNWHYLHSSDYSSKDAKDGGNEEAARSDDEDAYVDPNDDGNNYANPNLLLYSDLLDGEKSEELKDEDLEDLEDDIDMDIYEEEEESNRLKRSKSKGDMNWNEDEQKRLLTMANYIHNNTGGSIVGKDLEGDVEEKTK